MQPGKYVLGTSIHKSAVLERPFLHKEIKKPELECEVRQALRDRVRTGTATNSTALPAQITISGLKLLLSTFKSNIDVAKAIAGGRKATMPALSRTKVTKIVIPILNNVTIEGYDLSTESGTFNAEWVEYVGPKPDMELHDPSPDIVESEPERVKSMELPAPLPRRASQYKSKLPHERVILYLHGGAYVVASRRTHRGITSRLAKQSDALVLVIDYRLAPEHVFPAPLVDALSAYQYILTQFDPKQVSFVGDSAGAGLAMAMCYYCRDTKQFPMPGSIVCMSPYVLQIDVA
jgi:hypothetical protein